MDQNNGIHLEKLKKLMDSAVLWGLFFGKILQNVSAYVMVTDSQEHIAFVNGKFLQFFSTTKGDLTDKRWIARLIPEHCRKEAREVFKKIRKKRELSWFDTPVLSARHRAKCVSWICIPLVKGRKSYYMFIGHNSKCPTSGGVRLHNATPERLNNGHKGVINALFEASKITDPETAQHAGRVMILAEKLARELKLSEKKIEKIKIASLLHDLGKLAVDAKILLKPGKLDKAEFDEIKRHPHWGSEVIRLVHFLRDIIPVMASHHENYDGSGYPRGLKRSEIPLESRILTVADIYEALTSDRAYRKGYSSKEAMVIMEEEKGYKLDPHVTDVFLGMVRAGKINGKKLSSRK